MPRGRPGAKGKHVVSGYLTDEAAEVELQRKVLVTPVVRCNSAEQSTFSVHPALCVCVTMTGLCAYFPL